MLGDNQVFLVHARCFSRIEAPEICRAGTHFPKTMSAQEKILNQNPVSFLYEYTVKHKYPAPVFTDEGACGAFRNFQCTVRLEKPPIVACGSARTKILAKREAARKAVEQICPAFSSETNGDESNEAVPAVGKRKEAEEHLDFPKLNTINPQETIISLLRDVKWPDRSFSEPMDTLDGTCKIIVRAGPPENMNKFCGKGVALNTCEAKKSACCDLYRALEHDYQFLALWYSAKSPAHPVCKKLKAKVAEMGCTSENAVNGEADNLLTAQTPLEELKSRFLTILRSMKEPLHEAENGTEPGILPYSDLLEKITGQLTEIEAKTEFSKPGANTENNCVEEGAEKVELKFFWKETGAHHGYPRELSFDGKGATWKEAASDAADKLFGFLDIEEEDTRVIFME